VKSSLEKEIPPHLVWIERVYVSLVTDIGMRPYLISRGFIGALDLWVRSFQICMVNDLRVSIRLFLSPRYGVKGKKRDPVFGIRE